MKSYFENRQVDENYYDNFQIPSYLFDVLPSNKSARILDIGCGLGQYIKKLNDLNYTSVLGIDISREAVDICKSNSLNVAQISNIRDFTVLDSERFDFAICSHVLEHLAKHEIIETLLHIRENLLSANGVLVIMVPNAQSLSGTYWAYEDFTHNTLFTAGSLIYVLTAAGFKDIQFLDVSGLSGSNYLSFLIKSVLLFIFRLLQNFKFKITSATFHKPSPVIYTWEIKALASNSKINN
jgi:SAM-dependent methyltransferase